MFIFMIKSTIEYIRAKSKRKQSEKVENQQTSLKHAAAAAVFRPFQLQDDIKCHKALHEWILHLKSFPTVLRTLNLEFERESYGLGNLWSRLHKSMVAITTLHGRDRGRDHKPLHTRGRGRDHKPL